MSSIIVTPVIGENPLPPSPQQRGPVAALQE
jgi:hypothetical protein